MELTFIGVFQNVILPSIAIITGYFGWKATAEKNKLKAEVEGIKANNTEQEIKNQDNWIDLYKKLHDDLAFRLTEAEQQLSNLKRTIHKHEMALKKHMLALIMILALFSWSCRSQKTAIEETRTESTHQMDSVSRLEKRTTKAWVAPQSKAKLNLNIQQLAELPKGVNYQDKQGNATAIVKKADDGTLEITANCDSLTFLVESLEVEVYHLQKENKALKTTVNKEKIIVLSSWQNFQIWCSRILLGLFIIYIIYRKIKAK